MPYIKPLNAGLDSEPAAVGRRAAKLLDALEVQINRLVVEGEILNAIDSLRIEIINGLRAEGWRVKKTSSNRWSVLPPKEKKG